MGTVMEDALSILVQTRARRLAETLNELARSADHQNVAEAVLSIFNDKVRPQFEDLRKALSIVEVR